MMYMKLWVQGHACSRTSIHTHPLPTVETKARQHLSWGHLGVTVGTQPAHPMPLASIYNQQLSSCATRSLWQQKLTRADGIQSPRGLKADY